MTALGALGITGVLGGPQRSATGGEASTPRKCRPERYGWWRGDVGKAYAREHSGSIDRHGAPGADGTR